MKRLWTAVVATATIVFCEPVCAQRYTQLHVLRLAKELRSERVLSTAGLELLERRILATPELPKNGGRLVGTALWWVPKHTPFTDTVYDLSRASVLNFLLDCLVGETWYRNGEDQDGKLMRDRGIYGQMLPDPEKDSGGFFRRLRLLDSIDKIPHPGTAIEAAIVREDPWPPGWHTVIMEEDSAGSGKRYGHGYIDSSVSVSGKTRSKLVHKLGAVGLIGPADSASLIKAIRRGKILLEMQIVAHGLNSAIRKQEMDTSPRRMNVRQAGRRVTN